LNEEDYEKGDDRGAGVDDQLPSVAEIRNWAGDSPNCNHGGCQKENGGLPQKSEAWRAKRPNQSACWDTRIFAEFVLFFFMHK
jgi:hypothetical protein